MFLADPRRAKVYPAGKIKTTAVRGNCRHFIASVSRQPEPRYTETVGSCHRHRRAIAVFGGKHTHTLHRRTAGVIGHDDNLFARSGECYRQIRSAYNQLI